MDRPLPSLEAIWQAQVWPEPWAAAALGLTEEQLRAYRQRDGLPCARMGKHPYYLRDSIVAWFAERESGGGV